MIRLSGPGCLRLAGTFIRWPRHDLPPRAAVLAKAYCQGRLLDQVMIVYFPGPSSYTGEDMIEICAHGSPFVLAKILELLLDAGARPALPGEFTQRAYLNGRLDLAQAEAVCALIRARTRVSHRAALEQLEGGLSSKVGALRAGVLDLLAAVEADLDHPDEDLPAFGPGELSARAARLRGEITALASTHRVGRLAAEGARIAIVGRPNVGKSSLLNALLGRERAIVSEFPGTTRDTLEEWADLDGWKALFIDTAGLREAGSDPLERAGMERARKALASCDLALAVFDRSQPLEEEDLRILEELPDDRPAIAVLNKSDLPERLAGAKLGRLRDRVAVSALRGAGLPELVRSISGKISGALPAEEAGVLITSLRHRKALEEAGLALEKAQACAGQGELIAHHLRECLAALGEIIGETTSEDVLRTVFSKFCVGK